MADGNGSHLDPTSSAASTSPRDGQRSDVRKYKFA